MRKPPSFNGYQPGPDFDQAKEMMYTPFQYIDIALDTAATNQIFNVSGDFFYVDPVSTGTATLELNNQYADRQAPFQISSGFGLNALFKQIKLTWTAQPLKTLRLIYSTGANVIPALSGFVQTLDGGQARTLANQAFVNTLGLAAVAANNNHVQLWNAATSGKVLVVESFSMSSSTAQSIIVGQRNSMISTGVGFGWSKQLYGAAGVGQIRSEAAVGVLVSAMLSFQVPVSTPFVVNLREPIVIRPGYGLVIGAATVNTDLGVNFEWYEQ